MAFFVGVTSYNAKVIGDKVTKYQAYKILQSVVQLAEPVHSSIGQLQLERALTSAFYTQKNFVVADQLKNQYQVSDSALELFAKKLKKTEILLLSIPEAELSKIRENISMNREKYAARTINISENFMFYNGVTSKFEIFLEKMYKYSDDPEFQPLIYSLVSANTLKEAVSQECAYVSAHVSYPEIPPGEISLIKRKIAEQIFIEESIDDGVGPEIKAIVQEINTSPEHEILLNLRKRFDGEYPDMKGSFEEGNNYLKGCVAYLSHYSKLEKNILDRLDTIAKAGKIRMKNEFIFPAIIAFISMLLLGASVIILRKITPD